LVGLRRFEDPVSDEEVRRLFAWSRDEQVLRWSGGSPTPLSFEDFNDNLEGERLYGPSNRRVFFILARATGEMIGRIGVFNIDWDQRACELGIVIGDANYWGRGYGRDATRTLVDHIFKTTRLERIFLFTSADNVRARKSFEAAGFRWRGPIRRFLPEVGDFDGVEMEITRAEWVRFEREAENERTRSLDDSRTGQL
jgi:RimJ/RimL family protein N-acetyltransferase